jgi:hypothetical protein
VLGARLDAAAVGLAIFGYGSLVSPASAGETLGRPVEVSGPVRLPGWNRRWSTIRDNHRVEKSFAPVSGEASIEWVLGLNIEPAPGAEGPNGALVEISEAEADRIDLREIRYERADLGDRFAAEHGFDRVIAWVARPEHLAPSPTPLGTAIIGAYVKTVEAAFDALGPGQLDLFRETTGPPPVEAIDAVLTEDRIPPGNPTSW